MEIRSIFPPNSPFRALFRAFHLHPAHRSALRAEWATRFPSPGKRGWPPSSQHGNPSVEKQEVRSLPSLLGCAKIRLCISLSRTFFPSVAWVGRARGLGRVGREGLGDFLGARKWVAPSAMRRIPPVGRSWMNGCGTPPGCCSCSVDGMRRPSSFASRRHSGPATPPSRSARRSSMPPPSWSGTAIRSRWPSSSRG